MSKIKLLFGVLVITAIIMAGCTGTKTMVGKNQTSMPAGQSAAMSEYKKYAGELTDEINYLTNHYKAPDNATLDQYREWLDGYKEKLALCSQMYNNTSRAAERYLAYLNNTSDEYKNVTAADAAFRKDLASLNDTYRQYSDDLNTSIKKTAALEVYRNKLNGTVDAYNDLNSYAKGAKVDSESAFAVFLDGFKGKVSAFESSVNDAIAAGEAYKQYCDPGSDEYKGVDDNARALRDNVQKCWDAYNNYKNNYDSSMSVKSTAKATFNDYISKVNKAAAAKKDLDAYRGTEKALNKLDKSWLDGYRQKIDTFDADCYEAIAAGNACKQYLDTSGSDYKSIEDNEKNMKESMAAYDSSYIKLYKMYKDLHPLGSLM